MRCIGRMKVLRLQALFLFVCQEGPCDEGECNDVPVLLALAAAFSASADDAMVKWFANACAGLRYGSLKRFPILMPSRHVWRLWKHGTVDVDWSAKLIVQMLLVRLLLALSPQWLDQVDATQFTTHMHAAWMSFSCAPSSTYRVMRSRGQDSLRGLGV